MRSIEWSARLQHELAVNPYSAFVTLTYNDENLRYKVLPTLCKPDLQKYHKRLRKHISYKFYQVGEYGEKYGRPHYHVLMFSSSLIPSKLLKEEWPYGLSHIGLVESKSVGYVVSYIRKNVKERNALEKLRDNPFMTCSHGLGYGYMVNNKQAINDQESVRVNGGRTKVPRYYLKKEVFDKVKKSELRIKEEKARYERFVQFCIVNGYDEDEYKSLRLFSKHEDEEALQCCKNITAKKNLYGGSKNEL